MRAPSFLSSPPSVLRPRFCQCAIAQHVLPRKARLETASLNFGIITTEARFHYQEPVNNAGHLNCNSEDPTNSAISSSSHVCPERPGLIVRLTAVCASNNKRIGLHTVAASIRLTSETVHKAQQPRTQIMPGRGDDEDGGCYVPIPSVGDHHEQCHDAAGGPSSSSDDPCTAVRLDRSHWLQSSVIIFGVRLEPPPRRCLVGSISTVGPISRF